MESPTTSNTQKVVKGISSQTLVTIVLGVVEIISFSIMSRLLTKQDFGYYAAITAVVAIFSCFSDAGIGSAIIQRKELNKRYIYNAFTLSLIFGGVVSLALFFSAGLLAKYITDESMTIPLRLMSLTLLLQCMNSVNVSIMYRRLEFLRVGMINLFALVVTTIVAVVLALRGYGYYAIIAKVVITSILTLCLSSYFAKTKYGFALDLKTFRQIFGFSGWLMASGLFRNLAHDIDKLLMSRLLSVASLGAYNRPKDFIGQISGKLNGIFDTALFPVLSSIQSDNEKLGKAFSRSLYFMNVFAMLLTIAFVVNSELLIRVFFGEKWMDLKYITMVLSFLMLFNIDGRLADCFLRSLALTKQQFFFRILETIVTLMGVFIGAYWDIMGVAIGVVVTNAVLKILKIVYVAYKINIPASAVIREIVSSWRFTLVLVPLCMVGYVVFPNTLIGNIVLLILFTILCGIIFLGIPSVVGELYKTEAYIKVMSYCKRMLNRII